MSLGHVCKYLVSVWMLVQAQTSTVVVVLFLLFFIFSFSLIFFPYTGGSLYIGIQLYNMYVTLLYVAVYWLTLRFAMLFLRFIFLFMLNG